MTDKILMQKIEKDILQELEIRGIKDICGYGISIQECSAREKRKEPLELNNWIRWYFQELKSKEKK